MALIQFKRGTSARWAELNPILAIGEPGYDTDKGKLKIGDGKTHWNDLLFQDEQAVVSRPTKLNFPPYGKTNTIYKEEETSKLYQWKPDKNNGHYEIIGTEGVLDIKIINGGNANGAN